MEQPTVTCHSLQVPARANMRNGSIEIDRQFMNFPPVVKELVLYHEIGHLVLKTYSEEQAWAYAREIAREKHNRKEVNEAFKWMKNNFPSMYDSFSDSAKTVEGVEYANLDPATAAQIYALGQKYIFPVIDGFVSEKLMSVGEWLTGRDANKYSFWGQFSVNPIKQVTNLFNFITGKYKEMRQNAKHSENVEKAAEYFEWLQSRINLRLEEIKSIDTYFYIAVGSVFAVAVVLMAKFRRGEAITGTILGALAMLVIAYFIAERQKTPIYEEIYESTDLRQRVANGEALDYHEKVHLTVEYYKKYGWGNLANYTKIYTDAPFKYDAELAEEIAYAQYGRWSVENNLEKTNW